MNKRAHRWSVLIAILLVIIGIVEPLQTVITIPVPRFLPPSWQVVYMFLPTGTDWVYTTLWTLAGLVSLAGYRWTGALRLGLRMNSFLFLTWGLAGIPAIWMGVGGNVQGVSANLITAILALNESYRVTTGEQGDDLNAKVRRSTETNHGPN